MRIVVATHNDHKVAELQRILADDLPEAALEAYEGPEAVEDGVTFAENALIKAREAFEETGIASIADDSGIAVDALEGAPGIFSARYAGTRDDRDNLELLLRNLEGVADRGAAFVCAAAYVDGERELVEMGVWRGSVLEAPAGTGGFGYDPIFQPDDAPVSAAELSAEEKDALSHRRRAFRALAAVLAAPAAPAAPAASAD
ncbi:RdgB/HAM1 family non-canonical purine NTP pyrophosphatase [Agrococcus versicolor]|uniref:dITP/XTP pyrophosphatase n=1 Tax=Agrococcus versicolor TaxID=501482 RepID=A0ABN3AML4_9MICO